MCLETRCGILKASGPPPQEVPGKPQGSPREGLRIPKELPGAPGKPQTPREAPGRPQGGPDVQKHRVLEGLVGSSLP